MARAYVASTFLGYDIDGNPIERACARAEGMCLSNVHFEMADAAELPPSPKFDVITAFNAIHDQVDPAGVLRRIQCGARTRGPRTAVAERSVLSEFRGLQRRRSRYQLSSPPRAQTREWQVQWV